MRTRPFGTTAAASVLLRRSLVLLPGSLLLAAGLGLMAPAYAAPEAKLNKCWGQITKQFAPLGEHASAHSPFTPDPGEGGRRGVGNVSKEDHGPLSEGGQGEHAIAVGEPLGLECEDAPELP